MSDTGSTDTENRDQAIKIMTDLLASNGMPADLAPGAAADLVDMAIRQRDGGQPPDEPDTGPDDSLSGQMG